ncbi:MAG: hypothetical protein ACQESK_10745 [Bacteroidota bacterium]
MITNYLISKKQLSLSILLFINLVFSYKYIERISDFPLLISLSLTLVYFIILKLPSSLFYRFKHKIKYANISLLLIFTTICLYIFAKVDVATLNVDRWSVITNFWNAFFNGEYAYFSSSNAGNPPGPMPFYFIMALPFYLIGELGFLSLSGIFVLYFLAKYLKISNHRLLLILLFLVSSTFYMWEIVSRSNILVNSTLVLSSIVYFDKFKKYNTFKILITSIIIGCLLSTRNVFAIAYIVYFMHLWLSNKISFKELFFITILSIFFFLCTFIPFVISHFDDFFEMNPFIVQSTFLIPFGYTLMFLVLAFISSFLAKTFYDTIFYIGINLFISILIYCIYLIAQNGFSQAYIDSIIDISYFIFCIPFLLIYYLNPNHSKISVH